MIQCRQIQRGLTAARDVSALFISVPVCFADVAGTGAVVVIGTPHHKLVRCIAVPTRVEEQAVLLELTLLCAADIAVAVLLVHRVTVDVDKLHLLRQHVGDRKLRRALRNIGHDIIRIEFVKALQFGVHRRVDILFDLRHIRLDRDDIGGIGNGGAVTVGHRQLRMVFDTRVIGRRLQDTFVILNASPVNTVRIVRIRHTGIAVLCLRLCERAQLHNLIRVDHRTEADAHPLAVPVVCGKPRCIRLDDQCLPFDAEPVFAVHL